MHQGWQSHGWPDAGQRVDTPLCLGVPRLGGNFDLIALLRTFLIFFVGGLLMTAAVICLLLVGDNVWRHCLHDNPNFRCGDALLFAAVSPVYAIGIGMALNFLPLIVGAILAVFGRAIFRHVPLWYLIVIVPACVLAHFTQRTSWLPHVELRPLSQRLLLFTALQVMTLLICWWWDRRGSWD